MFRAALGSAVLLSTAALVVPAAAAEPDVVAAPPAVARPADDVARGVIVSSSASDATLRRATEAAADGAAEVQGTTDVGQDVTTVLFDEPIATAEAADVATELAARPDVRAAAPDGRVRAAAAAPVRPNDPRFDEQYQVWDRRTASELRLSSFPAGGYSVKAPSLWRSTRGSADVVVAVLDTGVRPDHPDLQGRLVAGHDMIAPDVDQLGNPFPGVPVFYTANDGDGRDADPSDPGDWLPASDEICYGEPAGRTEPSSWHGTHVAGIVAAAADNGTGIAGVAPGVKVQPVRVLGRCGGWDSDILSAIHWASGGTVEGVPANRTPADVINLSLGGYKGTAAERDEICAFYSDVAAGARERGAVVVAAAGNELGNANLGIPAACANVFSVGATSERGYRAFYSNKGSSVDISAMGGDTVIEDHAVLSTVDSGTTTPVSPTWKAQQGTSMAAPAVSAGAALLTSLGVSTPAEVEAALRASVSTFAPASSVYAKKVVTDPSGRDLTLNLNCTTTLCGKGILDLSKVPAPIGRPTVSGDLVLGETLTAAATWTTKAARGHQWLRNGAAIAGATGSTYTVTRDDVGQRLSVRTAPTSPTWSDISSTSVPTAPVPDGPVVTVAGLPERTVIGTDQQVTVTVRDGEVPAAGPVELRRGSTVLASGVADGTGTATLTIPGTSWVAGDNAVRAAFLGAGGVARASSVTTTVRVAKRPAKASFSVPGTVSRSKRAVASVKVVVEGLAHPTGAVSVYDGTRRIAGGTLSRTGAGSVKVTLPLLAKGTHRLKVVYGGSTVADRATSAVRTVVSR